jgi:mono/diheme cytochrome c family protein
MPSFLPAPHLVLLVVGLGLPAMAQDAPEPAGQLEYLYNCSACHGETGLGDGSIARYLNVETPGLTRLSAGNDGVFPLLHVIQVIDGRTGVGPHGTLMPIWGERFMASALEDAGHFGAEVIVRGRVLSLARYLETIQEE